MSSFQELKEQGETLGLQGKEIGQWILEQQKNEREERQAEREERQKQAEKERERKERQAERERRKEKKDKLRRKEKKDKLKEKKDKHKLRGRKRSSWQKLQLKVSPQSYHHMILFPDLVYHHTRMKRTLPPI